MEATMIIDQFLKGWSNNLPLLLPLFSDDTTYIDKPLGANLTGPDQLQEFAEAFFTAFPDIKFSLLNDPVVGKDRFAFEWRITGTHQGQLMHIEGTNKPVDLTGMSTIELRDGKITKTTDYWDLTTLLRQIGQFPS